jgi:hypothetical protein
MGIEIGAKDGVKKGLKKGIEKERRKFIYPFYPFPFQTRHSIRRNRANRGGFA